MPAKKRIICTVTNDLTYDQRMIRICTSLAKVGYAVTLVGRELAHSKELQSRNFQQKRLRCFSNQGKFFYIEYNLRLFFFLLFTPFDVINSIDLDTLLPGYLIAKIKRKTCVYDAHEYFTEVPEVVSRPRIQKMWKSLEAYVVPRLEYCYTVGGKIADLFTAEYKTNFSVVRNVPFALEKQTSASTATFKNKEKKILLYQGALNEGRGIESLIESMQFVDNAELQLAGEGDLSQELRQLAKDLKVEDRVKFLGFIQPENLKKITQRADIGLNLLENKGLSYYYSLANKAFDYIQAVKPSIHMAFPEYVALNAKYDTFLLIDDLEINTIVTAIKSLLENGNLYNHYLMNCTKAAQILTWENEEKTLLDIYRRALAE